MTVLLETINEVQGPAGWSFGLNVVDERGTARRVTMTLSWADYNHWSRSGADRPSAVAEAVVMFLASRDGSEALKAKFDASLARRLHADADSAIPTFIHDEL